MSGHIFHPGRPNSAQQAVLDAFFLKFLARMHALWLWAKVKSPDRSVPYDNKAILLVYELGQQESNMFFYCITVSNSVYLD